MALVGYALVAVLIVRSTGKLMRLAAQKSEAGRRYAAGLLDSVGNVAMLASLRLLAIARRLLGQRLDAVFTRCAATSC